MVEYDGIKLFGITPAYAGNTPTLSIIWVAYQDHPRLRGEHCKISIVFFYLLGSPPPTRGTLHLSEQKLWRFGITPAYAGNTVFICLNPP